MDNIISFDCKRCDNRRLKACPYLDKRTDDFCEGFHITEEEDGFFKPILRGDEYE